MLATFILKRHRLLKRVSFEAKMMKDVGIKTDSGTKLKHTSPLYIMRVSPLLVCAKLFYIDATI
jgi:hypothetical protein